MMISSHLFQFNDNDNFNAKLYGYKYSYLKQNKFQIDLFET